MAQATRASYPLIVKRVGPRRLQPPGPCEQRVTVDLIVAEISWLFKPPRHDWITPCLKLLTECLKPSLATEASLAKRLAVGPLDAPRTKTEPLRCRSPLATMAEPC
jgi:hypothetical protein